MKTTNAMQLKARIKARAQKANVSPQLMMQDYTFERKVDETDEEILKWNGGIYAIRSTVRWGGSNYGAKREELNVIKLWRKKP